MPEPVEVKGREPSVAAGAGLAFAIALAATLLMAAPVVRAPSERLFGSRQTFAPADPNRDPLVVIEQFRTGQVPVPYLQPLTDLPGRALARLVGAVAAYNIVVLASFPLAAALAYLLARYLFDSHLGAMVAALAYAFLPFHVAQATQHPHVAQTQWLPLYFLALWRCLDRPDLARAALLLAATAAVTLSNFYGALIAAVLCPVALVAYAIVGPRRLADRWRGLAFTTLTLAAALALALFVVHRTAPLVLSRPGAFAFPRADLFFHSARWWSYLVPPVDHPIAFSWVRNLWTAHGLGGTLLEQQVSLGWSLLILATVPLWHWLRGDRSAAAVRMAPILAIVAFSALLCSLSPERRVGPFLFVRPSAWLYEAAPMFRAYARFGVVVGLMTTLLAGAGTALLWRSSTGRRVATLLLGLGLLEMAPWPSGRWRDVLPTRAHRWLAAEPGPLRVLDCAPASGLSDALALPLLGHEATLIGTAGFDDCGEPRLGDKLAAMGYTHVVARRDSAFFGWLAAVPLPAGLARGPRFEDASILEVKAESPVAYVSALLGFHPREYEGGATWRWMGQEGSLRITTLRETAGVSLELELLAFPGDRFVAWSQDGQARGTLPVTAEWRWHELALGTLAPGETTVTFRSPAPAVVAAEVLGNGDRRALGLAVGRFRVNGVRPDHSLRPLDFSSE